MAPHYDGGAHLDYLARMLQKWAGTLMETADDNQDVMPEGDYLRTTKNAKELYENREYYDTEGIATGWEFNPCWGQLGGGPEHAKNDDPVACGMYKDLKTAYAVQANLRSLKKVTYFKLDLFEDYLEWCELLTNAYHSQAKVQRQTGARGKDWFKDDRITEKQQAYWREHTQACLCFKPRSSGFQIALR